MRYLLDTNVCVDYLNGRFSAVTSRIQTAALEDLCTSSVVAAELRYGADRSLHVKRNHARLDVLLNELECLPFDEAAARAFGRVRAHLESRGTLAGPYDMMIAAHALAAQCTLVTDNVREFKRVRGLPIENWRLP